MKLYATKADENELYFQLEKTSEGLEILDTVVQIVFGDTGFFFDMEWQNGLPEKEAYLGHEYKKVFIGATISENKIHLLIRGIKDKKKRGKVKTLIYEKYEFVR